MKRTFVSILCFLLILCVTAPSALAADGNGQNWDPTTGNTTTYVHEHSWSEWTVRRRPTCYEEGLEYRVCGGCEQEETRAIPKTDHTWGGWQVTKRATCEA